MVLSEEEVQNLVVKKIEEAAAEQAEIQKKKANHKIQIWFVTDRKLHGTCSYSISFWESGKRLHGGGDEMMFLCRRHEGAPKLAPMEVVSPKANVGPRGCGKLIPGGLAELSGFVVCPHCQTKHRTDQIGDSVFYKTSIKDAAKVLADWWRKLDCDADVYVKYAPSDPRTMLMAQTMGFKKARELKGLTIYPLAHIIQDTLTGATVESRFEALLTA